MRHVRAPRVQLTPLWASRACSAQIGTKAPIAIARTIHADTIDLSSRRAAFHAWPSAHRSRILHHGVS
ncbi:hypothetical protein PT2222_50414 [Paraburkholderia tropica]